VESQKKELKWELFDIAVAKAIRTKPNTETLISQSFPLCLVPSAFCYNLDELRDSLKRILDKLTVQDVTSLTRWQFIVDGLSVANI